MLETKLQSDLSLGVSSVDVLAPSVKSCNNIEVGVIVHRQDHMFGVGQCQ